MKDGGVNALVCVTSAPAVRERELARALLTWGWVLAQYPSIVSFRVLYRNMLPDAGDEQS